MDKISELLDKYRKGDKDALNKVFVKMTPLVKHYAKKIHFIEMEDSIQEFYMALLETIPYLDERKSEGECLSYIKKSVENKYAKMCKKYFTDIELIFDEETLQETESESNDNYDMLLNLDFMNYILAVEKENILKGKILRKFWTEHLSDAEIAEALHISRQYVHRIKKILIKEYLEI